MKSNNLKEWITLLANFSVLVGLFFLVLEMKQDSAIAIAQARLDYAAAWRDIDSTRQDEAFAELINKSLSEPEQLSITEIIRLDAYYWGVVDQMLNAQVGSNTGVRLTSFEEMVEQTVRIYFANPFAMNWWLQTSKGFTGSENMEFKRVVDDVVSQLKITDEPNHYEKMQRKMLVQLEGALAE